MNIKYVIFDVGMVCYPYTLEPLNEYMLSLTNNKERFIKQNGIKSFDYNPFMKGEIEFSCFCKELCEYSCVTYCKEIEKFIDDKMKAGVGEFYEETIDVIQELKNNKIGVCLLSNALPNLSYTAEKLIDKENIFVSFELGLLKPDIKIYEKVLEKLKVRAKDVVFIDDKKRNVDSAISVGMVGVVFNRNTIKNDIKRILCGGL